MSEAVEQVIDTIIKNRAQFEAFCLSLTDEESMRPVPGSTWLVKDFASHLATLDTLFVRYTDSIAQGGQFDMTRDADGGDFNLDRWNDAQVAERRAWPMARIFEEAATNRAALIENVRALSEDDLSRTMHFRDPKRGTADFPFRAFLVGWAQHDPIHAADMIKALPERATDPELTAWLANPFVTGYQAAMSV
jgi:hypothetical protein